MAELEQERKVSEETEVYRQFTTGTAFKHSINLFQEVARATLFENGIQWVMDEDLDDYSKITLNVIKLIGKTNKSHILQNEYGYLVNSTNYKDIRKIQDFLKYLSQSMNLRRLDIKMLADDYTKGTAIMMFYWDLDRRNYLSNKKGCLRAAVIDIRRFVVADPYNQDLQDQEWVIYNTEVKIGALKKKYGEEKCRLVVPDGKLYTKDTEKTVGADYYDDELVNVYVKFYRNEDGEVLYTVATQTTVLVEGEAMNPYYWPKDVEPTPETMELHEKKTKDKRNKRVWNLYPFVRLCLNERDNCFYGYPIALEYVEAQKSINNHFAVYDKALQDNVLGGFVFKKGLFGSQEITTDNGQILEAEGLAPGERIQDVFTRFPSAQVPADSVKYSQALVESIRSVAGASNVQIGMSDYAGQSGRQTELLIQRAKENSSINAILFNEYKRDQAYIMFLFAMFYYENENFIITEHGYEEDNTRPYMNENSFNGPDYIDDDVIIDIRVGPAPAFSEYANIEIIGLAVQSGQVPFEAYLKMLPDGMISNRQEILRKVQEYDAVKQKIRNLEFQNEQLKLVIEQMTKAYEDVKKDRANIDLLIRENDNLKKMLADVSAKAVQEKQELSEQIKQMAGETQRILQIFSKNNRKK